MANAVGSKIKTWVLGNKAFKISWTFKQHRAFGGLPKKFAGIDIGCPVGTNLYASEDGIVAQSFTDSTGANVITLKHKTRFTQYVHLLTRLVEKEAKIKKGQLIGKSGKSGNVTGAHLHFALIAGAVYDNSKRVDPYQYLVSIPKPISAPETAKAVPAVISTEKTAPEPSEATNLATKNEGEVVKMPESKRFTLNTKDARSIAVGALIAVGGALVAYFSDVLSTIDFGKWAYIAVPVASILVNALRKFIEGSR